MLHPLIHCKMLIKNLPFRNRDKNRKKAKELLRQGKAREALEHFRRCVEVTSEMAFEVISACRARNVDVVGN